MKFKFLSLIILLLAFVNTKAQIGRLPLSPFQKIEQNIGVTDITLKFSRPSMRERKIFGALVPYNTPWRTGANRNTTIRISEDVIIDGTRIKKGEYAIFTIPNQEEWEVLFYNDTSNWNVPEVIEDSKIVARITVVPSTLRETQEVFNITIGDFTNYQFDLNISWEKTLISIPIALTTKEIMDAKIAKQLNGPVYDDYYLAAVYQMESGKEYQKGLNFINNAIETKDEGGWWDLRVKAKLLLELNRKKEAKKVAKEGLKKAIDDKRESAIKEFKKILKEIGN